MGLGRQNFILVRTYSNCHQNRSTRRSRSSWKSDKVKGGRRKSGRINSSGDRQIMKLAINFRSKLAQLPGKPQKEYPPSAPSLATPTTPPPKRRWNAKATSGRMAMTLTAAIMMMGNGTGGYIRMAGGMGGGTLCRVGVGTSSNCCSDSAVAKWEKALSRYCDSALHSK